MSRVTAETGLRLAIESAQDPELRACLRAELAAYVARMGDFDQARSIVSDLRNSPTWKSSRLSVLLMLAEALIALRNEHDFNALDRLSRGFALAIAFRELDVAGLVSAWLAQFNYNRLARAELGRWVAKCVELRPHMSKSARTRFCLTQGSIASYIGDMEAAKDWYQHARSLAVATQDEAFLAAAMYNRAALGISRIRVDQAAGAPFRGNVEFLAMEIDSAIGYSHVTRNTAATSLQKLWKGRLLMVQGDFLGALPLIVQAIDHMPEIAEPNIRQAVEADVAICKLELSDVEGAMNISHTLPREAHPALQVDDCIVYYSQLTKLARAEGDPGADGLAWAKDRCIDSYHSVVDELRGCLAPADASWSS